jgi:hypothetical protein
MADVTGAVRVTANDREYTLWVGFSVLAELQERHGQDVLARLEPPADAGEGWMPDLAIVRDLLIGALKRFHEEEADRWLVDDLFAQNPDVFDRLMTGAFPDVASDGEAQGAKGKTKRAPRTP